jgi:hypothetical protein
VTYLFHDLPIASDLPLVELPRTNARPSLVVRLAPRSEPEMDPAAWFHEWTVAPRSQRGKRAVWLAFARLPIDRGFLLRFPTLADFEVSPRGDRVIGAPAPGVPRVTMRHLLLDQVLPLALHLRGRLALHASAVEVAGFGAIAFAGPAGAGKSTLAAACAARHASIIADDCLVFARDNGSPAIVPGYPGVRLWPDAIRGLRLTSSSDRQVAHYTRKRRVVTGRVRPGNAPVPLRVLFVLGPRSMRARAMRVRSLSARDRVMSLVPYSWLIDVADRAALARVFDQLCDVAAHVPVLRLTVGHGRRGLRNTADEVLALARAVVGGGADS